MKPFHWTLIAACLASCHTTDGANSPPSLGPGSRVVIPSVQQPRAQEPTPEVEIPPTPQSAPRPAANERLALAMEAFANAISEALTRTKVRTGSPAATPGNEPDHVASQVASTDAAQDHSETPHRDVNTREVARDAASLSQNEKALRAAAKQALDVGDLSSAAEFIAQARARPGLEKAQGLSREGRFEEARTALEQALKEAPDRPELLEALGYANLSLADANKRDDYRGALDAFQRTGPNPTPTALLGMSRAACALGEFDQALDWARRAIMLLTSRTAQRLELSPAPEIVLADAGLEVHRKLRANPGPASAALFTEIERALKWRIEHVNPDAAAHAHLAALYLDVGKVNEAEAAAGNGLNFSPGDPELTALLARAALSVGGVDGPERLIAVFKEFHSRFKNQPLFYWYQALEFFKSSVRRETLSQFESSDKSPVNRARQREAAKSYFAKVRSLDARYKESCLQYEALCVALDGWEWFDAKDFVRARQAFKSMNAVLPGSVALDPVSVDAQLAGRRIESGVSGLEKIALRCRELKNLPYSAAVYADLADLLPNDPRWAREAAESAKLVADSLTDQALDFESAARGEVQDPTRIKKLRTDAEVRDKEVGTPSEPGRFAAAVQARKKSADEYFEKSWNRYKDAVRLAPLDVRLACDAAHVAVYHPQGDLAPVERLLENAIRLANEQLQGPNLPLEKSQQEQLQHSKADALADQGKLELDIKGDPDVAIRLFNECLDTDPRPRPGVREQLLPRAIEASKKLQAAAPPTPPLENSGPKKQL